MIDRYGVIIGAMKAATTTLFDVLATHPAVAPSTPKEPKYFAQDPIFEKGPGWYRDCWDFDPAVHALAMEASTHYSMRELYPETVARIDAHPGEFRFVYVVRNPADRIESQYQHAVAMGWPVAEGSLDTALVDERLLGPSRYAYQLEPFAQTFGSESVLVLRFEDVTADVDGAAEQVCAHWDLDASLLGSADGARSNRTSDKIVSNRVNQLRRVPGVRRMAKVLDGPVTRSAKRLLSSKEAPVEGLDAFQRLAVIEILRDDLNALSDTRGIDVSDWLDGSGRAGDRD